MANQNSSTVARLANDAAKHNPAFPQMIEIPASGAPRELVIAWGMSKREAIAAQILASIAGGLAEIQLVQPLAGDKAQLQKILEAAVETSIGFADLLLEKLNPKAGPDPETKNSFPLKEPT